MLFRVVLGVGDADVVVSSWLAVVVVLVEEVCSALIVVKIFVVGQVLLEKGSAPPPIWLKRILCSYKTTPIRCTSPVF